MVTPLKCCIAGQGKTGAIVDVFAMSFPDSVNLLTPLYQAGKHLAKPLCEIFTIKM